jgi:hypothetical protein
VKSQPIDAWHLAKNWTQSESAESDQLICVTGSFFIAAELRHALLSNA